MSYLVIFEVFTAAIMKNAVFLDVEPCRYFINLTFRKNVSPPSSEYEKSASNEPVHATSQMTAFFISYLTLRKYFLLRKV
jgi:hypothetical protein